MIMRQRVDTTDTGDASVRPGAVDRHDPVVGASLPLLLLLRAISSVTHTLSAPSAAVTRWVTAATGAAQRGGRQTRATYLRLAERGEARLADIRARPRAADALATVRHATGQTDDAVQSITDEVEETAEEALARTGIALRSAANLPIRALRSVRTVRGSRRGAGPR
jgi:hypothetical protein